VRKRVQFLLFSANSCQDLIVKKFQGLEGEQENGSVFGIKLGSLFRVCFFGWVSVKWWANPPLKPGRPVFHRGARTSLPHKNESKQAESNSSRGIKTGYEQAVDRKDKCMHKSAESGKYFNSGGKSRRQE
jgi:hypothetical protein